MTDSMGKTINGQKVPLSKPWFDERESRAAFDVVKSGWVIFGPKVEEFEEKFAKNFEVKHAVAVNSGSSALLVAMAALGIQADDEVIVPNMTFVSTATAAMWLGAKPVFADIQLDNYCMSHAELEKLVTPKTRAIVPVHYAGQSAEMGPILEFAKAKGIPVLEDAAESHLARYQGGQFSGTLGDIGIFSFTPTKPMVTGEGGMIVTHRSDLAERCRLIRNFGDTGKFCWDSLGFNFRMPEVNAAMGLLQLEKLPENIRCRRRIAQCYTDAFAEEEIIICPWYRQIEDMNFQLYTIRFRLEALRLSRDEIMDALFARGISSRLYYPELHKQKVFERYGTFQDSDYPNTIEFSRSALSLPIFPGLEEEEQVYVVENLLDVVRKAK